jgi:hypothetical protein
VNDIAINVRPVRSNLAALSRARWALRRAVRYNETSLTDWPPGSRIVVVSAEF